MTNKGNQGILVHSISFLYRYVELRVGFALLQFYNNVKIASSRYFVIKPQAIMSVDGSRYSMLSGSSHIRLAINDKLSNMFGPG